jgi:hypothetical protein
MRFRFTIRDLLLVFVIIALALGWWIDHLRIARLENLKWEYDNELCSSLDLNHPLDENALKRRGKEGWEICGIIDHDGSRWVYFKRPQQ